ncbi:YqeG family HAD IIIA-type phosphatase [Paenibacillus sp.]|uniref:YqeG family HAD IIIA-type phosphatase n=1 Tax=Paenibacillus sp. TaxID=58172 RepID=UPI002D4B3F44|nr:YqeG family HAD IIIA-type phosphatase [Paenibacillus sp.]HZG84117.1 YqeG family HAD IIIA-type phosphatase [Paenibacillus sp.]
MLQMLLPKQTVRTIYDIDLEALKASGIRGIMTDLDNTLVGAKVPLATPELVLWLDGVRERGFQVVVVSNNNEARVRAFAEPLRLPFVSRAKKPLNAAFSKALTMMGLRPHETAIVGDQMMTDVLGGNRLGLYTILVEPIAASDEGWVTRNVNRNLERAFITRLRKKGWLP